MMTFMLSSYIYINVLFFLLFLLFLIKIFTTWTGLILFFVSQHIHIPFTSIYVALSASTRMIQPNMISQCIYIAVQAFMNCVMHGHKHM